MTSPGGGDTQTIHWTRQVGRRLAPWVGGAAFPVAWVLGIREWGVLLGGGFGWLPAAFVAAAAAALTYFAWLPVVVAASGAGAVWLWRGGLG